MASSYSPLKVELIGTGEQAGSWGTTTNTNLGTALEEAITGRATATFTSDANFTLPYIDSNSAQVFRNLVLNVTSSGNLTSTRDLIIPAIEKQYFVENNTTNGQSIRIKTSAGTGVTIPNGKIAHVYCDGTNTRFADDFVGITGGTISGLTTALGVTSGGTGLNSATQGDILYASASNTYVALPKNTSATRYLSNTGTSNNPAWAQIDLTNGVTGDLPLSNLAQGTALSVLGVTGGSTADNASIAASLDHQVLRRSGTSLSFGAVALNQTNAVTGALPVANGGTGLATVTSGALLIGAGTSAFTTLTGTVTGQVVSWNNSTATWEVGTLSSGVSSFSAGTTGFTPSTGTTGAVTLSGTLNVANGGTGRSSLTANNVLIGNGTSAVNFVAPSTSGNALVSNGTSWESGNPARLSTASGSAPSYSARAWVNFDGTNAFSPNPSTTAIRASGNVSSITDNNTGDYTINLTTAMPNANYVIAGSSGGQNSTSTGSVYQYDQLTPKTTSAFRIGTLNVAGAPVDSPQIAVAVFV